MRRLWLSRRTHGADMEKSLLDIVSDFALWKGDAYRLAVLVATAQKEADAQKLDAAEMPEAAEIVRG